MTICFLMYFSTSVIIGLYFGLQIGLELSHPSLDAEDYFLIGVCVLAIFLIWPLLVCCTGIGYLLVKINNRLQGV